MSKKIDHAGYDNPYLNAKAEWLERYGDYISQKRNWQIIASLCLCITLISVLYLGYMGTQNKLIPYIIEVDKLGNTAKIGIVENSNLKNQNVVKYSLNTFIYSWRTIWGNAETQRKFILDAYTYLKPQSTAFFQTNDYYKSNNPFERGTKEKVDVKIKSIVPQNINTWQVEWEETSKNLLGEKLTITNYKGLFQIEQIIPTTEEQIRKNPLGIFVTDLNYAKIL
ncbi:VirB8/TrbF family protein [Sulfurospirillum cavolei]|uniref:VirB8/TrbF family protein n=1 Tax=Sulfurospirillum cavolei TaxID=366522 RepID=UPI003FA2FC4E